MHNYISFIAFLPFFVLACGGETGREAARSSEARKDQSLTIAAAADLKFAFAEVIEEFTRDHPEIAVTPTFGSSGSFFTQISNGAPFDLYFSADIAYPRKLVEAGLGIRETEFRYAIGRVVVWAPSTATIDVLHLGIESLLHTSVRKIAIANPQHAPYGRAAEAAMRHYGVYDRVKDRLVLGENVAQTAQFIESGAADIGIIALSLAMAPGMRGKGTYWTIPGDAHPAIEQGGVIIATTKRREAAQLFRDFVVSDRGRKVLAKYGFVLS